MKWTLNDVKNYNERKKTVNAVKNPSYALGRMKAGKMNKSERLYADLLDRQKYNGTITEYWFEAVNLRIGENCFYKPDFLVMLSDGRLELHEVKGFLTDDSLVKMRAVAEKYPFPIKMIRLVKGEWEVREF